MVDRCPHCGSILPEPSDTLHLAPVQRAIYDFVARHPDCDIQLVHLHIYGDIVRSLNSIRSHVCQINTRLRPFNQRIQSRSTYRATWYTLIELPLPAPPLREKNKEGSADVTTNLS